MIIEIVEIKLLHGTDQAGALVLYQKSAQSWIDCPDLVEKYYIFDKARGIGGGVYVWADLASQQRWHGPDYIATVRERYGSEPRISVFDAVMHLHGRSGVQKAAFGLELGMPS